MGTTRGLLAHRIGALVLALGNTYSCDVDLSYRSLWVPSPKERGSEGGSTVADGTRMSSVFVQENQAAVRWVQHYAAQQETDQEAAEAAMRWEAQEYAFREVVVGRRAESRRQSSPSDGWAEAVVRALTSVQAVVEGLHAQELQGYSQNVGWERTVRAAAVAALYPAWSEVVALCDLQLDHCEVAYWEVSRALRGKNFEAV